MKILIVFLLACNASVALAQPGLTLIDGNATAETKAVYCNLYKLSEQHILFGHQHATEYGHGWWGDANRSDVKSVTGSHPAVIGVDFSGFTGSPDSVVAKYMDGLRKTISDTYNRGGVTTVAWHFINPVSPGGFYWVDSVSKTAVPMLMPGGSQSDLYKVILKKIAAFCKSVKGKDGALVPMIFRPYHEIDGDWFWWGRSHCSAADFKSLWHFTVAYLRDSMQVHNLIYAFSPDCIFTTEQEYLERYPGNEWVDLVGMDDYADFGRDGHFDLDAGYKKLKIVSDFGANSGKLAAFTETGLESIPDANWWTEKLLATLQRGGLRLCYVLVWRNDNKSPTHFYAPFPGQVSAPDFIRFFLDSFTLFENDLKNMYR